MSARCWPSCPVTVGVEIPTYTLHVILERRIRKHIVEVLDEIVVELPRE